MNPSPSLRMWSLGPKTSEDAKEKTNNPGHDLVYASVVLMPISYWATAYLIRHMRITDPQSLTITSIIYYLSKFRRTRDASLTRSASPAPTKDSRSGPRASLEPMP